MSIKNDTDADAYKIMAEVALAYNNDELYDKYRSLYASSIRKEASKIRYGMIRTSCSDKCFICGNNDFGSLEQHHILPVNDFGDNDPNNLIALCKSCHGLVHKAYKPLQGNNKKIVDDWILTLSKEQRKSFDFIIERHLFLKTITNEKELLKRAVRKLYVLLIKEKA